MAYIPSIFVNLFSITPALKNGSNLSNKGQVITVQKGSMTILFDQIANTKNGFIAGVIMHPTNTQITVLAKAKVSYQQAHQMLGHAGSNYV